ncbi:MAG: SigE family RNA polymerase sigma factor [Actinobacteria bacterium]|nr:SigE family RNA polymerase sigma factor [Actinomycetota bacterium]
MATPMDPGFEQYVRGRQQHLVRAAYLMCGDAAQAEDLVQEALIKLAGRWSKLRFENPDGYVRRILYHDAISAWRSTRREVLTEGMPDAPHPGPSPADRAGLRTDVIAALRRLPERQRAVVVLRYFEDRSEIDTAEVLGISVGTVKSQAYDGLANLRKVMGENGIVSTKEDGR